VVLNIGEEKHKVFIFRIGFTAILVEVDYAYSYFAIFTKIAALEYY
jgi:hypothetical protein